jgi:hypothetical protein
MRRLLKWMTNSQLWLHLFQHCVRQLVQVVQASSFFFVAMLFAIVKIGRLRWRTYGVIGRILFLFWYVFLSFFFCFSLMFLSSIRMAICQRAEDATKTSDSYPELAFAHHWRRCAELETRWLSWPRQFLATTRLARVKNTRIRIVARTRPQLFLVFKKVPCFPLSFCATEYTTSLRVSPRANKTDTTRTFEQCLEEGREYMRGMYGGHDNNLAAQ